MDLKRLHRDVGEGVFRAVVVGVARHARASPEQLNLLLGLDAVSATEPPTCGYTVDDERLVVRTSGERAVERGAE